MMIEPNMLHDYLKEASIFAIMQQYHFKRKDIDVVEDLTSTTVSCFFTTGNEDRQVKIIVTIPFDVKMVPCEPTSEFPQPFMLEGFWLDTTEVYKDPRKRPTNKGSNTPYLCLMGLPAVPPPKFITNANKSQ